MIDLFYECEDSNVESYTDDTTPYICATDIPSISVELQASASKLSTKKLELFQLKEFLLLQAPTKNY